MNPATGPLEELIKAGLHRLAQPLTAGVWLLEAADDDEGLDTDRLRRELRRTIGVLTLLRGVLEDTSAVATGESQPAFAWLACHAIQWKASAAKRGIKLHHHATPGAQVRTSEEFVCCVQQLLAELIELGPNGSNLAISTERSAIQMELHASAELEPETVARARANFDPFRAGAAEYDSVSTPDMLRLRGRLAHLGYATKLEIAGDRIALRILDCTRGECSREFAA